MKLLRIRLYLDAKEEANLLHAKLIDLPECIEYGFSRPRKDKIFVVRAAFDFRAWDDLNIIADTISSICSCAPVEPMLFENPKEA